MKHINILSNTFALVFFFIVSFFALDFNGYSVHHFTIPKTATVYAACAEFGMSCNGPTNACGDYYTGVYNQTCQCSGATSAPPTPYSATACGGGSNACFSGTSGTTDVCTGACVGSVAPQALPGGYGNACNVNSCGTAGGTINCSGTCSGGTPAVPYSATACNVNACGTAGGTTNVCTGACSGGTPATPYTLGAACNRNSCGGSGTINDQCSGTCSASAPPQYGTSSCTPSCATGYSVATNGTTNNCTGSCTGGSCTINSWTLSISANGGTMGGTAAGSKNYNTAISITQTPPAGYAFTGWSSTGSVCTGTGNCTFNMPNNSVTVTANYTLSAPTVTTPSSSSITDISATLGATIASGASITSRGTCWSTSSTPSINCVAEGGTAVSAFSHSRTGFNPNTLYYYRGYAVNAAGTGYSADGTFTTLKSNQSALTVTNIVTTYPTGLSLTTSGGSGSGAVTYSLVSAGTSGCSVTSGGVLSYTNVGTCTVNATKAADTNYNAVTSSNASITINQASQATLNLTNTTGTYGSGLTVTSSGGSGTGALTYALSGAGTAGCSVTSGGVVSFSSAGTCTINVTKAADTNYLSANSGAVTVTINPIIPSLSSPTQASVSGTTATLGATVTSNGGATLTARGTCWGSTPSPVTNCTAEGSTVTGTFTQARTGLTAGSLIYYRGYATNGAGTGYSADDSFTTGGAPILSSPTASNVTGTTATLGATLVTDNGSSITARGICFGLTPTPITNCVSSGTAIGIYTQSVTGLPINSTIYYRGYATNVYGTSYSSDATITTPNIPTLTTTTLTALANTTATFGATLFSNGGETVSVRGTCWDYTAFPTANCLADGSTATGVFTQARNGLPQGSLIYFRGYATNSAGTGYSSDNSTTTLTTGTVTTPVYSSLADTTVTLGATVVSNGGSTILSRGTCWGLTANPVSNCLAEGGTTLGAFTQARSGLPTGTVIYVRGYVTNAYGTTYTIDNSFTTFSPPVLISPTVSSVTNTTATFGANVTSDGGAVITARGTCFGTSPSPVTNCIPEGGISTGVFTQARTLLTPNTLMYIRGYATNVYGTSYSGDISTTTLPNLTGVTVTPGNTQVRVDYITTASVNPYTVIILRSTSPIVDAPVNSTIYTVGNTIGASTVGCVDVSIVPGTADGCVVSSLTNNTPYYFKVFTKETATGIYDAGTIPDGSPSIPDINATLVNLSSFRTRNDDGTEISATYNANENTPVTNNFLLGDKLRARFVVENQKTVLTNKSYQLEYATGTCTLWTQVPRPSDVTTEHFRVEPSSFITDNTVTTHSGGVSIPNGKTFKPGRVQTFSNITQPIVLKNNEYTEIEYSLRSTANVTPYVPYCFRLTGRGDASDFNYSQVLHITPFSSVFRAQAGGGGGGGASAAVVNIEAPTSVATTTTTGGTVNTEATTPTEQGGGAGTQQSTTTPTRRQGGGGNVGLLNPSSFFAVNTDTAGKVLGVASVCVVVPRNLHRGIESASVTMLQKYLISLAFLTGNATGFYGDATVAAVKKYQYSRNIKSTGMVYEETRRVIQEESCGR